MNEPEKNCGGDLIDWEFEEQPGGITIKKTPKICAECEFFQACFMSRSSQVLGMSGISDEDMKEMVLVERQLKNGILPQDIIFDQGDEGNNIPSFEDNMRDIEAILYESCPGISESVVKKHIVFTELLEEYQNQTITGIKDFLDNRGYELDCIKNADSGLLFTEEESEKINKGKLLLGLKKFSEWDKGEEKIVSYVILAEKENKWGIEGVMNAIQNVMNPNPQGSMS